MMNWTQQADLDDLLSGCRADNAKRAFAEAIACYRAGAYRATILATWTAVLFDYLSKLRELELAGNADAAQIVKEFDRARAQNDIETSLRLEREALQNAADKFELLTPLEKEDLDRLARDRNRCAHPSLLTLDDPYHPTAELARAHMRHAVVHMLSRPPVQGKEAWDRLWGDVTSEYFPSNAADAEQRLRPRLVRARPTLVNRLAIELTKRVLTTRDASERDRSVAALAATISMHHAEVEVLFREKLASLVDRVPDEHVAQAIELCRRIDLAWSCVGAAAQNRLELFVAATSDMQALDQAAHICALRDAFLNRLKGLQDDDLVVLAKLSLNPDALDEIVQRIETKRHFATYRDIRAALRAERLTAAWSDAQLVRLVTALTDNADLLDYAGYYGCLREVLALSRGREDAARTRWRDAFDQCLLRDLTAAREAARQIRAVYPEFPVVPDEPAAEAPAPSNTVS